MTALLRCWLFCTIAAVCAVGCGGSRAPADRPIALAGHTMGTTYTIKLSSPPHSVTDEALHRTIEETLDQVDRQMSTYRPDSEISRFNAHEGEEWFPVSRATAQVVADALRVSQATGGAFDPTVAPLVDLWSFGPDRRPQRVPSDDQIAATRERVGYQKVEARTAPPALRKRAPDLRLDLSAIAKGYAVDLVAELVRRRGVEGFLVEIGGETRVHGTKANGQPWVLGIEAPVVGVRSLWRKVQLLDGSLATSGDYRNFFDEAGRRYSHMIDPRTGRPIAHAIASVSVLERECARADAMATALAVLGPEEGYGIAVEQQVAAMFILRHEGELVERVTPAFATWDVDQPRSPAKAFLLTLVVAVFAFAAMMTAILIRHRRQGIVHCDNIAGHEPEQLTHCRTCSSAAPGCDLADQVQSHTT